MVQAVRSVLAQFPRTSSRYLLAGVVTLSLGAVACSGNPAANNSPSGGTTVKAEMGYKFNPKTINAETGKDVVITLDNQDSIAHDWTAQGVNGATIPETAAKKKNTITFKAPAAGTYKILCTLPGHAEAGMTGELVVK